MRGETTQPALSEDIIYVPTWAGFVYLAIVLDVFSRRVVGWAMATRLRTERVLAALNMDIGQRGPDGVVHHTDKGPWATSAPRSSNGLRRRAPHVQRRPPIITTKSSDSAPYGSTIWRSIAAIRSCLTHRSWEGFHRHRRSLTSGLVTKAQMCPRDRGNFTPPASRR